LYAHIINTTAMLAAAPFPGLYRVRIENFNAAMTVALNFQYLEQLPESEDHPYPTSNFLMVSQCFTNTILNIGSLSFNIPT